MSSVPLYRHTTKLMLFFRYTRLPVCRLCLGQAIDRNAILGVEVQWHFSSHLFEVRSLEDND